MATATRIRTTTARPRRIRRRPRPGRSCACPWRRGSLRDGRQRRALGRRVAGDEVSDVPRNCNSATSRWAMTAIRRCIISPATSPPARCSRWSARTAPASRRCFAASSASSSRSRAQSRSAVSMRATSPICRRPPRSTAAFRSPCSTSSAPGCGARPACSAASARPSAAKIAAALAAVGLTGFENRTIGTLSGGQMQRLLFARVMLQDARLIVLDEPFNAIDARTSADLLALVKRWHARGPHRGGGAARHRPRACAFSRKRCCSRASRSPGARPRRC